MWILNGKVSENGVLTAQAPESLRGKEVVISVLTQEHPQSNWEKISAALKEADSLDISRKKQEDILAELREMRES
jgi:hypothetical protein